MDTSTNKLLEHLKTIFGLNEDQCRRALHFQERWKTGLAETMVHLGYAAEGAVVDSLERFYGIPRADFSKRAPSDYVRQALSQELAEKYAVVPLERADSRGRRILTVAMANPMDLATIQALEFETGYTIRPVLAGPTQIAQEINRQYRGVDPQRPEEPLELIQMERGERVEWSVPAAPAGTVELTPHQLVTRPESVPPSPAVSHEFKLIPTGGNLQDVPVVTPQGTAAFGQNPVLTPAGLDPDATALAIAKLEHRIGSLEERLAQLEGVLQSVGGHRSE